MTMKKTTLTTLAALMLVPIFYGQEQENLDTIYANEFINTALFFPEQVRQGTVGSPNFLFSFNQEEAQYFGLVKATPGRDSNLLVLTRDGSIYSYILRYRKELPRMNYFIREEERIGKEVPEKDSLQDPKPAGSPDQKDMERLTGNDPDLEKRSGHYLGTSSGNIKTRRNKGLRLRIEDMIYHGDNLFLVMQIRNRSGIRFELDHLQVSLARGNNKKNASFQKLVKEPVYRHRFPETVPDRQTKRFVLVLPKFTLGNNERIEVEVREKKGNRALRMKFRGR